MSNLDRDREIYLQENRYRQPKEVFKHLARLLAEKADMKSDLSVCDIGCAAGEFLYHLRSRWRHLVLSGFDPTPELIAKALTVMPNEKFFVGSVHDPQTLPPASQDVLFMSGVHSGISSMQPCLANMLAWLKPGGRAFLYGIFNPYPIDVEANYCMSGSTGDKIHFYVHSCKSISDFLDASKVVKEYSFTEYTPPIDIEYNSDNPFRAWTARDENGERILINGLSMLVHCFIVEIVTQ
ncbi:Methyltransferase type 11 [Oleidesulfovibrio alaskensis G20]|jgi:SAM-dependent methyltransferase|uniref:Methyltransferase type 11 n=1 Tax=Oleidesulfovibrio alaskensis (strain ATCC BAA-1058 / DSM 17464 / G20) TaxID=207559 RepID=Q30W98_OLEA2|nr:class I SAM-dependent methyltransferase [Oleidesulfovibrio alaskensis]ABB40048.1 Methyltransferase type 11 [Oleidesulfovibrio alaskensis G20]MBG0773275.1 class I SAM-dependent methyltransferase [Oleidesulfovibrio alaskensis]